MKRERRPYMPERIGKGERNEKRETHVHERRGKGERDKYIIFDP